MSTKRMRKHRGRRKFLTALEEDDSNSSDIDFLPEDHRLTFDLPPDSPDGATHVEQDGETAECLSSPHHLHDTSSSSMCVSDSLPSSCESLNNFSNSEQDFDSSTEKVITIFKNLHLKYPTTTLSLFEDLARSLKSVFPEELNDLPTRYVTIFETDVQSKGRVSANGEEEGDGTSYYFGILNSIREEASRNIDILKALQIEKKLLVSFSTDGFEPFEGPLKQCTCWPLLAEIHFRLFKTKPILVKVYCGEKKPSHTDFFHEFCSELSSLIGKTVKICDVDCVFKLFYLTADTPARSFMKGCVGHNATKGCERCVAPASRLNHRMHYPSNTDFELRTHQTFVSRADEDHHRYDSCFETVVSIDMINDFALDPMHLLDEGVMKRLLFHLLTEARGGQRLQAEKVRIVNNRIDEVMPFIPSDFNRKLTPLRKIHGWKACMYRLIDTYLLLILFKDLISEDTEDLFVRLFVSVRILRNGKLCTIPEKVEEARKLLKSFVEKFEDVFGESHRIYNIHTIMHLPDVVDHIKKPLDYFSSYSTEDALRMLKRHLKAGPNVVSQIIRRRSETLSIPVNESDCLEQKLYLEPRFEFDRQGIIVKVWFRKFFFKLDSLGDSFLVNERKQIFKAVSVNHRISPCRVHCICLSSHEPYFNNHVCNSAFIGMMYVKFTEETKELPITEFICKAMVVPSEGRLVSLPLLHTIP
ncbi:uncharacterized protein LOC135943370 [Cloeon dipterum]|uniref:uncharacterized protein LOC135943370 n=1 Tax=Cloeon dipterum TaxID=197152 RepID=UPI00321F850D